MVQRPGGEGLIRFEGQELQAPAAEDPVVTLDVSGHNLTVATDWEMATIRTALEVLADYLTEREVDATRVVDELALAPSEQGRGGGTDRWLGQLQLRLRSGVVLLGPAVPDPAETH